MKWYQTLRRKAQESIPTLASLKVLIPQMIQAAQKVYDEWDQDNEGLNPELGAGGICQDIAEEMAGVLSMAGIDSATVSASVGDQHVWVFARFSDGVYSIDIPPGTYESGSGYVWRKKKDVRLKPSDLYIDHVSSNPDDFEEMTSE